MNPATANPQAVSSKIDINQQFLEDFPFSLNGHRRDESEAVFSEVREIFKNDPQLFLRMYRLWGKRVPDVTKAKTYQPENDEEKKIRRVCSEVLSDGYSVWRGYYGPEVSKNLLDIASTVTSRGKTFQLAHEGEAKRISDTELCCAYEMDPEYHLWSRMRCNFFNNPGAYYPEIIKNVMNDRRGLEVGSRVYGVLPNCGHMLCELLEPSKQQDSWHIDGIKDQYKMMILLDDVKEENGAMHIKPGLYVPESKEFEAMVTNTFNYGRTWSYPSEIKVQGLDLESFVCTGKAGDAIFFDTLNMHRGTFCRVGQRLAMVLYFAVPTKRSMGLGFLGGEFAL